ncbi:MAG TPA: non-canonical purine NTP pyrophosphatase [Candidatus Saccharimonadales bacterium]|nr:non-canonical purine NTP pyrophosphatase [Candidatus Saccharimonadales bacterium]
MQNLTFITGNPNKVKYVTEWLGMPLKHHKLDVDEIQSLDLHEIVEHKVRQAYDVLQSPVLVEDASLTLTAMGRLPGTYIKWFIEELGIEGLHKLATGLEHQQAVGRVCYGLHTGIQVYFFDGEMRGRIATEPRGNGGFGFDKIFINDGFTITRAEMAAADYAETSYRMDGLRKLRTFLSA